jgi:hypothetical protein
MMHMRKKQEPTGTKKCGACGLVKPLDDFHRHVRGTFGRQALCKPCSIARAQAWRRANPEYSGKRAAGGYWRSYRWDRIRQRYGLARDEYDALLEAQGGVCAICGGTNNDKHLVVDHDHATDQVRGLLCGGCNHALGFLERDDWLQAARAYLSRDRV